MLCLGLIFLVHSPSNERRVQYFLVVLFVFHNSEKTNKQTYKKTNKFSFLLFSTAGKKSSVAAESSDSMVMIVAVMVGVLGTVAVALIVAVVIISRRRRYASLNKDSSLIVAEEM